MKYASMIARYLMALMFLFAGSNGILQYMKAPPPPSPLAGEFMHAILASHFLLMIAVLQFACGLLLLIGRFVPLALTILAGILVNIVDFHVTMDLKGIVPGLVMTMLWFLVFAQYRRSFRGILTANAERSF